ncbi:hypothetical protein ACTFTM_04240 [Micromonospora sp. RB23]
MAVSPGTADPTGPDGSPPVHTVPGTSATRGGLSGADYVKYSRNAPTTDGGSDGRWIAADESGWDGEALFQATEPYMTIGSVAIDDGDAATVLALLRRDAGIKQAGELKFSHFARGGNQRRLEVLARALRPGGMLAGRASIFMIDKRFFVTAKIIDLLLEEYAHENGVDLHADDQARRYAQKLIEEGPRALGAPMFHEVIRVFVRFAGIRNRGQALVEVAELFQVLDAAERRSHRRAITDILNMLLRCRAQADELQKTMLEPDFLLAMEPLIPTMPAVLNEWSRQIGPASLLMDAHKVMTDDRIDILWKAMTAGHPDFRNLWTGVRPRGLARGDSSNHPSIQLADLVAGAGRAVAHFHEGLTTSTAEVGAALATSVAPLITPHSLIAHDEPARFSRPKESRGHPSTGS